MDKNGYKGGVLPYRAAPEDLVRLLEARARGWTLQQIRSLNFSVKSFEGTVLTAQVLGFLHSQSEELTELGRRFALASQAERQAILLEAIRGFEPYGLLLEAIFGSEASSSTETDWVERWWSTHGYGSSQSNRAEGATVFGRFAEYAGLGSYVQGRRGHPTRVEWHSAARMLPTSRRDSEADGQVMAVPLRAGEPRLPLVAPPLAAEAPPPGRADDNKAPYSTIALELRSGRVAQLTVPSSLTRSEKERLLSLLDLLITVTPDE